jgi:hypothetical protein
LEIAAEFVERLVRATADSEASPRKLEEKIWKDWEWPVPVK